MHVRSVLGALVITTTVASGGRLEAQVAEEPLPLAPLPQRGQVVAPYFDGWYANDDGSYTLSFGYLNRNTEEVIEIPLGADNFIEPAEFNGIQPTSFYPANYGGFSGRRERGVFAVRVPAEMRNQDVWWTLRLRGQEMKVPGRVSSDAYELGYIPMAAGSLMPALRLEASGAESFGREGIFAAGTKTARVGEPVDLSVWVRDRGERDRRFPVNATWIKHQGPGRIDFSPATGRTPSEAETFQELSTTATFDQPGEYVIRVRVDNFTASDSSFADQCCWSNGYVRVNVTR